MTLQQQMQLDENYLMQTYKRKPVEFVRGQGMHLYDDAENEYLDFFAGAAAVSVGHANARVTQAIQEQAAKLLHVSNFYYVEGRGELAKKISDLLNAGLVFQEANQEANQKEHAPWKSFFANSGAEANEGAIKLARKYGAQHLGGASVVVSAWRSFHGRTLAALAATGQPSKQESFRPLPAGFCHVELNDTSAIKKLLSNGVDGQAVCAVLLECIQGEGGIYPCSEEYIKQLRKITQELGILLIIDEIQTGFYRTGRPFAFQHYDVLPDVVTLAKGLGAGVPIGAFAACGTAATVFEPGDHGSTFGGGPLVIAAANAVLDELKEREFAAHVLEVGAYLEQRLLGLPLVTQVRGKGLMLGIEMSAPVAETAVAQGLQNGLVLNNVGQHIMRFLPPLVCTKDDVDILIGKLKAILEKL